MCVCVCMLLYIDCDVWKGGAGGAWVHSGGDEKEEEDGGGGWV